MYIAVCVCVGPCDPKRAHSGIYYLLKNALGYDGMLLCHDMNVADWSSATVRHA